MRAPLISMLTIPSIRIEEMTIDFNAKLSSVETADSSVTAKADLSVGFSYAKMVNLKASASYQKTINNAIVTVGKIDTIRIIADIFSSGL